MDEFKRTLLKVLTVGFLILLLFSFWSVCAEKLRLFGLRVDVLPFLVAFCTVFFGKEWGAGFGCFIGVLADAASGKTAGYYTILFMVFAILIGFLSDKYYRTHLFGGLFSGYALYLISNLLRLVFSLVIHGNASFSLFFTYFIPAGLYSLIWSIPAYLVLSKIYRQLEE